MMKSGIPYLFLLLAVFSSETVQAEIQFDVFPGFGGVYRHASWFPVTVEVYNDGPVFMGTINIIDGDFGHGNVHQVRVELPTDTRKRIQIPVFAGSSFMRMSASLTDEKGKKRSEIENVALRPMNWDSYLLGALPRTFSGTPELPAIHDSFQKTTAVARIQPEQFPNSPLSLQVLSGLYLNAVKAVELSEDQSRALTDWIYMGGHLILAVESPIDLNSQPWLRRLTPFRPDSTSTAGFGGDLVRWLAAEDSAMSDNASERIWRKIQANPGAFFLNKQLGPYIREAEASIESITLNEKIPYVRGTVSSEGVIHLKTGEDPLIIESRKGRGRVTVLAFSPEREPLKSWRYLDELFARMMAIPPDYFQPGKKQNYSQAYRAIDGLYGAMVDSRQVRKLPVVWLVVILFAYLIVIGPVDYFWLKKINRQILTWVTFPLYVVFFSGLIYYIGYRLRAGETEWNEIQVVDVVDKGGSALLKGRTYGSIYSPVNASYQLRSPGMTAGFRPELQGLMGGGMTVGGTRVVYGEGDFQAEMQVPVWTSQLYVQEWIEERAPILQGSVGIKNGSIVLSLINQSDLPMREVTAIWAGESVSLGDLPARESLESDLGITKATRIHNPNIGRYVQLYDRRKQALGDTTGSWLDQPESETLNVSLLDLSEQFQDNNMSFLSPTGDFLGQDLLNGHFIVTAWVEGHDALKSRLLFEPKRSGYDTFYRFFIPWEHSNQ